MDPVDPGRRFAASTGPVAPTISTGMQSPRVEDGHRRVEQSDVECTATAIALPVTLA
jgi:hypothetical protein